MEKWKTLHRLESPLEGDSAQSDFIKRLFQKSRINEQREWINQIKDLPKTQRLLCRDPIGNQKDRLPNQKSKLHQILVVPPEGGTLRRSHRNAGRLLPTPRRHRRSPLQLSVRTLPKGGSTASSRSRYVPFEPSP